MAMLGAVNEVVAPGQCDAAANALADALAAGPRTAQGVIRGLVCAAYECRETDQLDAERDAMTQGALRRIGKPRQIQPVINQIDACRVRRQSAQLARTIGGAGGPKGRTGAIVRQLFRDFPIRRGPDVLGVGGKPPGQAAHASRPS